MKLGLTQKEYADKLDVSLGSLNQWEQNRKQIFKSTWEKYFKHSLESCGYSIELLQNHSGDTDP